MKTLYKLFTTIRNGTVSHSGKLIGTTRALGTIVAVIVTLMVVGYIGLGGQPGAWIEQIRLHDEFGKVIVESPEVYTRERLVNDRLSHAVWLENQMDATEQVLKEGHFRSLEGVWGHRTSGLMSWRMGGRKNVADSIDRRAETATHAEQGSRSLAQEDKRNEFHKDSDLEESSIELFRAMNQYREHIRTELMQTTLDDRHDIDGNTLYRLNFNTTIIHGRSSDALAIIRVKLTHGKDIEEAGQKYYVDLLRDWSRELEVRLNDVASNRVSLVIQGIGRDRDIAEYYQWIRWRICKKLTESAKLLGGGPVDRNSDDRVSPERIVAVNVFKGRECGSKYYKLSSDASPNMVGGIGNSGSESLENGNQAIITDLDWFLGDYIERFRFAKERQDWLRNYITARPELLDEFKKHVAKNERMRISGPDNPVDFLRYLEKRHCNGLSVRQSGSLESGGRRRSNVTQHSGGRSDPLKDGEWKTEEGKGQAKKLRIDKELRAASVFEETEIRTRERKLVQQQCALKNRSQDHVIPMLAVIDLYWHLSKLERMLWDISENKEVKHVRKMRVDEIGCREFPAREAEKVLDYNVPTDDAEAEEHKQWVDKEREEISNLLDIDSGRVCTVNGRPWLWLRNLAIEQQKDQFERYFVNDEDSSNGGTGILAGIVSVDVIGCEASMCRISVTPLMGSGECGPNDGRSEQRTKSAVDCFYDNLNRNYEAFSYGITPKNLRQRLAFGGATGQNISAAFHVDALKGGKGSNLFEGIRQEHETLRSVMSQPIVVGFGRGATAKQVDMWARKSERSDSEGSGNDGMAAGESVPPRREIGEVDLSGGTEFGWIVAPEKRWGNGGDYWHPHRQYDLSAVVSIPSWWRRVTLTVSSCWRNLSDVDDLSNRFLDECDSKERSWLGGWLEQNREVNADYMYSIKLPGDIEEVSRKLRIEVRDVPYIIPEMFNRSEHYVFRVGSPASIVIEGGRLWRSTRVTLGTQSADAISVLPHMKGIVAEFDCVEPPPYWPTSLMPVGLQGDGDEVFYGTKVQVWTSEGVTSDLPVMVLQEDRGDAVKCNRRALDGADVRLARDKPVERTSKGGSGGARDSNYQVQMVVR